MDLMMRRKMMMMQNPEEVIFGVPPIVTNKKKLIYLKAFGGTEQNGTPTPDAPVDIVSNNGVLKARHQSGLPFGYTVLEYLQSSGSQYIDTGRVPNNDDIIEQKFQKLGTSSTTCSWYGSMPSSQTILPRIGIGSFNSRGVKLFAGTNNTNEIAKADTNIHTLRFQATDEKELTYTFDGVTNVLEMTGAVNMYAHAIELTSYLFARHGRNGVQVYDNEGTKIYYHREYLANGTLVLNMIPVKRNSDNVLGMYDLVSGQFFTNQGTGDFTAGDPVSDPVEIYTDGTVETVEVDTTEQTAIAEMLLKVGDYQDVQSIIDGVVTRNVGVKVLDGTETWNWAGTSAWRVRLVITTIPLNQRETPPLVCNMFEAHSWNSPNTAQPQISIVSDGTTINFTIGWNTDITTLADWKQWLADQYNAGTPVIVVYPLATPTTESVAGQTLTLTSGTNVIDITQASLQGLELEVKVK